MPVEVLVVGEYPAEGGVSFSPPDDGEAVLPLDAQLKILKGVMENLYREEVSVVYRQQSNLDEDDPFRRTFPLPVVVIDGEEVLRGRIHLLEIVDRLTKKGVSRHLDDAAE